MHTSILYIVHINLCVSLLLALLVLLVGLETAKEIGVRIIMISDY